MFRSAFILMWISSLLLFADPAAPPQELSLSSESPRLHVDRWPAEDGEVSIAAWRDNKTAAFSFTIDDNHAQDIPFWDELAQRTNWRWTWFLITGMVGENPQVGGTWAQWRSLAEAGHEIGSHSRNHLRGGLSIMEEYQNSLQDLQSSLPQAFFPVLAYPNGYKEPNDATLASQVYTAARGTRGLLNPSKQTDFRNVNSVSGAVNFGAEESHWASFEGMLNPRNRQKYGAWYVCHFHNLSPELREHVESMMKLLEEHRDQVWVAPFGEVAAYAQQRDTAAVERLGIQPGSIRFRAEHAMDAEIFRAPLTARVRLPDGWRNVTATQEQAGLPARIVERDGRRYAIIEFAANGTPVTLTDE